MALGLMPVFSLFVSTTSDVSSTVDDVLATTYANELIDSIVSHKFADIPANLPNTEVSALPGGKFFRDVSSNLTPCGAGFKRYLKISEAQTQVSVPVNVSPLLAERYNRIKAFKIVRIKVTFKSGGRARELEMATIVTGA